MLHMYVENTRDGFTDVPDITPDSYARLETKQRQPVRREVGRSIVGRDIDPLESRGDAELNQTSED